MNINILHDFVNIIHIKIKISELNNYLYTYKALFTSNGDREL